MSKPLPIKTPVYDWSAIVKWLEAPHPTEREHRVAFLKRLRDVVFNGDNQNGALIPGYNLYRLSPADQLFLAAELGNGSEDYAVWLCW